MARLERPGAVLGAADDDDDAEPYYAYSTSDVDPDETTGDEDLSATEDEPDDDEDDDESVYGAETPAEERKRHEDEEKAEDEARSLLDDAQEDELGLTDYRRYYRRLKDRLLMNTVNLWRQGGLDNAARIAQFVHSGQHTTSHLTQLYASRHLRAQFRPFNPGPDILDRPGITKLQEYMRPGREIGLPAQLRKLETLVSTDLQLTKVRTFYSAFDEDMKDNRSPIKLFRRVTGGNPCALCEIAADQVYFSDDLMPIHDNCQCDIEEETGERLTERHLARHHIGFVENLIRTGDQVNIIKTLAEQDAPPEAYHNLVRIEQHGELGPVLTWKGQDFRGPEDLPVPRAPRPPPSLPREPTGPVTALPGPGLRHEERMARNRARVEAQRRQREELRRRPVVPAPKPPVKLVPRVKPPPVELGRATVALGPQDLSKLIDWDKTDVPTLINVMATKHAASINPYAWQALTKADFTNPHVNPLAARRTLQAIDEMLDKYPDVHVDKFRIGKLPEGTVAQTEADITHAGRTVQMTFSDKLWELSPEQLSVRFKAIEDSGHFFEGASEDPYRAAVYHEYGHVLDSRGGWLARRSVPDDTVALFLKSPEAVALQQELQRPDISLTDIARIKQMQEDAITRWLAAPGRVSGYSMADMALPGEISPITGKIASLSLNAPEASAQAFDDVERRGARASDLSHVLHDKLVADAAKPWPTQYAPPSAALKEPKLTAVQALRAATAKPFPWSDVEMAAEDNPKLSAAEHAEAKRLAIEVYQRAVAAEPGITAAVQATVEHNGGHMYGLDHRLKDGPSLYRKIQKDSIDDNKPLQQVADGIKDAVRFTGIVPEDGFWDTGHKVRVGLESLGAKTIKSPIGVPLRGYRGRNMAFQYGGHSFELQINTEPGEFVKDKNHVLYNTARKLDRDDPQRLRLEQEMQRNWDAIPITKGTPIVQTENDAKSGDLSKILYVAENTRYRGPTVISQAEAHERQQVVLGRKEPEPPKPKVKGAKRGPVIREGAGGNFVAPHELLPKTIPAKGIDFLDHEKMVQNIMALYNDTTGDNAWIREAGKDWYPSALAWVRDLLQRSGQDWSIEQAAGMVAQYSENASWTDNMMRAENYAFGRPSKAFKATDVRVNAIVASDDPLSMTKGPKINNFVRAILGDPNAVAVDRWAARIALGTNDKDVAGKILGRTGGYDAMAEAYREAARRLGVKPSEVQAITWVHTVPPDATVREFKEHGGWQF